MPLEVFVATAGEVGASSAAAGGLSISQAGVSRSIAGFGEADSGFRILERTRQDKWYSQTRGAKFHARVSPLLESLQDAVTKTLDDKGAARGCCSASRLTTVFLHVSPPTALGVFLAENPELTLDIVHEGYGGAICDLESVDLDIRFGAVPRGSFIRRKLGETRVITVAAPRYIELRKTAESDRYAREES